MTTTTLSASISLDRPRWRAWALFAPLALWLLLFVVAPTAILLVYSFFRRGDGPGEVLVTFTLENFKRCFEPRYLRTFWLSIKYAAGTTALCALVGYPVAYYIGRAGPALRNRLIMLVMIPFWTSFLIRAYAWMTILSHDGLLNGLLRFMHVIPLLLKENVDLLYTKTAVLIALVYSYLPFMILPIYGSVEKLDESLLEAAADLGAGPVRRFIRVILPLTMPGIAAGAVMVFVPAVAMFAITTLMSGGNVRLIGDEIQDQCIAAGNLPFGSALGMVLLGMFAVTSILLSVTTKAKAKGEP